MTAPRRVTTYFGYVAPVVALLCILAATFVDPQFSWATRSLSSMGEATGATIGALDTNDQVAFDLFNAGLLVGGVVGLPFLYPMWTDASQPFERAGVGLLGVALLSMVGVAVAFVDGPYDAYHGTVALLFYLTATLTVWFVGTGRALRGLPESGVAALWVGNLHVLVWAVWAGFQATVSSGSKATYFAVPEFVGALLFGGWILTQAMRLSR